MKNLIVAIVLVLTATAAQAQATIKAGIKHLQNENYTAALEQFNAVAKADTRNATVYYWIGEVSYVQDNPTEADKAYRKGLSVDPQCAACKVGLGKLALDQGKTPEANEYFESAARLDKKNAENFAMIGDAYLYSKKPDAQKAIYYLNTAKTMNVSNATYWAHLGDAYLLAGDNGEAVTHYETAISKDPSITSAYVALARIWMGAQAYDSAINNLKKAIERAPEDANPYKYLVEVYIIEKKYDLVTPLLEKYLTLIGDDVDAKVRYVKFLTFQAKDYDRAISEGEKLLIAHPDQYTLHRWLAWSYAEKGMFAESYKHSNQLFDAFKEDDKRKVFPEDYDFWAKAAFGIDSIDEAAHIYRKLIEFQPERAEEVYVKLAKAYFDKKNYEQAIAYYNRKGEVKKLTNTEDYYLGLAYFQSKQYGKADTVFTRVLEATPSYTNGWYWKAKIADKLDEVDTTVVEYSAKPYWEKYIEFGKADPAKNKYLREAYQYLGVYYVQKEQYDEALKIFEEYLTIDPTDEETLNYVKIIREGTGKSR
jgi:tetratricopeptide (TPR) repeat protein